MSSLGKRRVVVLGVIALEVVIGLVLIYQLYAFTVPAPRDESSRTDRGTLRVGERTAEDNATPSNDSGRATDAIIGTAVVPAPKARARSTSQVLVPRLVGMSSTEAVASAARLGLATSLHPAAARGGIVYAQNPASGSVVGPGATIQVRIDAPPRASFTSRLTHMDANFKEYNDKLGAHITCTSTTTDDRGIRSYRWVATGLGRTVKGTGKAVSFILPGYRPYGTMMVVLTVTDSSGQASTYQHSVRVNWSDGTLH